jgi:hypothetical protein
LAAEHALPHILGRTPAKQIDFERLEIEDGQEVLNRGGHRLPSGMAQLKPRSSGPGSDARAGLEVKPAGLL